MDDSKIVPLRGAVVPNAPVAGVVEDLRALLAQAERGELRAFAFAVVRADGSVGTGWAKPEMGERVALSVESHGLGAGVLTLAYRYAAAGDA